MAEIVDWDVTDANNVDLWPEGMLGGTINNSGRAMQGLLARWFKDTDGSLTASGSSNAFAVTSNRTISALTDGLRISFKANHSITGAATLNLNTIGAVDIERWNGGATSQGDIVSGQIVDLVYSSSLTAWLMQSVPAALVTSTHADFGENGAPGNPAANTGRLYAKDVNSATRLAYRDSAGTEYVLGHQGELMAILEDRKSQNTAGGTFTNGADRTRDINTEVYDRGGVVSIGSNRFTLVAGDWLIEWSAPAHQCDAHQSFLYNFTDSTEVARGSSESTNNTLSFTTRSVGSARVSITSAKAFEIRHRCGSTRATDGFGAAANFGTEVYTRVVVRRA